MSRGTTAPVWLRWNRWLTLSFLTLLAGAALFILLAFIAASNGNASVCGSATDTWTGGAGTTRWEDAGNWTAGHVPTSTDYVCIGNINGLTVQVTAADTAAALEAHSPVSISAGSLTLTDANQPSSLDTLSL